MKTIILSLATLFVASIAMSQQDIKLINDVRDMKIKSGSTTKTSLKSSQSFRISCKSGENVYEVAENGSILRKLFTITSAMCGKEMKLSDALKGKLPTASSSTSKTNSSSSSTQTMKLYNDERDTYIKIGDKIIEAKGDRKYFSVPCIPGEMVYKVKSDGTVIKKLFKIKANMCGKSHKMSSLAYRFALGM